MRHAFASPCLRPSAMAASLAVCLLIAATLAPAAAAGATTAAGPSSPGCGGTTHYKVNGTPWVCTFDDEFSGTSLDTSAWTPQLTSTSGFTMGPSGAQACYVDNPNNISVSNGHLQLTVRKERAPFTCGADGRSFVTRYTSGEVTTYFGFHQQYGKFAVRARLPQTTVKGLQETLWLWPINALKYGQWPSSGEIDFAEFYSQYHRLNVPYIHYVYAPGTANAATHSNVVTAYDCKIHFKRFNRYVALWAPGIIIIRVNGRDCLVDRYTAAGMAVPAPFDQPFLIALTQGLGVQANEFDPASTPLPATLQIDYVRVWK
jgi:beta-glucanase (GH16 family)